jgi:hydrogenase nickel incorporation protein HypA/HybF
MHELGIAQSILDLAAEQVPAGQLADVRSIRIRVGDLAGVVVDSLEFCFDAIIAGTPLGRARLEVERVPAVCRCGHCAAEFALGGSPVFACRACGGTDVALLAGRELQVVHVELADTEAAV